MMIGAGVSVLYTAFFKYLWAKLPYNEEYTYPLGLGVFGSGLTLMAGSKRFVRAFLTGWVLGWVIR